MKSLALLLLACGSGVIIPDVGSSCDCDHAGAAYEDFSTNPPTPLEACTPLCSPTTQTKQINGAPWCDGGVFVCFGSGCCTREAAR